MKRSGHTLVELMAVISGVTAVLAGAIVLMQFMLAMSGEVRERTHTVATLGRLAEQFRRDVHAALGEPVVARDQSLELALRADGHIRWGIDGRGDLYRWENSTPARQNTYRLPKGTAATLEMQKQGAGRIVALRIESADAAGPTLAIDALVGRDERLAVEETK